MFLEKDVLVENEGALRRFAMDLRDALPNFLDNIPFDSFLHVCSNVQLLVFQPNKTVINNELDDNWEVLTEAVQTIMRYEGINDAYEQLKSFSRGRKITRETYIEFVTNLKISKSSKDKLLKLTPFNYIGLAKKL